MADNSVEQGKKILDAIAKMIESANSKLSFNTSKKAIIQEINEDGTVNIVMNGQTYSNVKVRSGLSPTIGEVVTMSILNNNLKDMYVDLCANVLSGGGEGTGEINTASNIGSAGIGLFKQKLGVDLQFKKINAGSSKVSITDDTANNEVDIDIITGTTTNTACAGDDSRLSNARTPTSHASSHVTGGTDVIPNAIAGGNSGSMSGTDKTKLDGISPDASKVISSTINGNIKINNAETVVYTHPTSHTVNQISDFDTEVSNNSDVSSNTVARHSHLNKSILDIITQTLIDTWNTISNKADTSNVLTLDNTTAFNPTLDYHPATKKYVIDSMTSAGLGDMLKSQYDTTNNGIVDNAEKVAGYTVGNSSGSVPISNGTLNVNLNSDKIDGYEAGNASGNIPVSNGTLCTNLNASKVNGVRITISSTAPTSPTGNGELWLDLSV